MGPSWLKGSDPNFTINVFGGQPGALATVSNFTSYTYCSDVVDSVKVWGITSQIPSDYTKFINSLVEVVVPVIILTKLFAIFGLFKNKKTLEFSFLQFFNCCYFTVSFNKHRSIYCICIVSIQYFYVFSILFTKLENIEPVVKHFL